MFTDYTIAEFNDFLKTYLTDGQLDQWETLIAQISCNCDHYGSRYISQENIEGARIEELMPEDLLKVQIFLRDTLPTTAPMAGEIRKLISKLDDTIEQRLAAASLVEHAMMGRINILRTLKPQQITQLLQYRNESNGDSALHLAAYRCHPQTVKFLLGHGAFANTENTYGETALLRVCRKGNRNLDEAMASTILCLAKKTLHLSRSLDALILSQRESSPVLILVVKTFVNGGAIPSLNQGLLAKANKLDSELARILLSAALKKGPAYYQQFCMELLEAKKQDSQKPTELCSRSVLPTTFRSPIATAVSKKTEEESKQCSHSVKNKEDLDAESQGARTSVASLTCSSG